MGHWSRILTKWNLILPEYGIIIFRCRKFDLLQKMRKLKDFCKFLLFLLSSIIESLAVTEVLTWGCDTEFIIDIFIFYSTEYNIFSRLYVYNLIYQLSWPSVYFMMGFWYFDSSYSDLSVSCVLLCLLGITGRWSDWVDGGGGDSCLCSGSTLVVTALHVIKTQRKTTRGKTERNPMKSRLWLIGTFGHNWDVLMKCILLTWSNNVFKV